jgi:hypothetical protein
MTAFIGAEALINSRPLTVHSANPSDEPPLTPNRFISGQSGGTFAPNSVDTTVKPVLATTFSQRPPGVSDHICLARNVLQYILATVLSDHLSNATSDH